MIPALALSAGLFMLIATVWSGRIGASTVAAIFGVFAAFWLSFAGLVAGLTSGWWGITADGVKSVQSTYLLSFLLVFVLLTLATLRLPLAYTVGFVFVDLTFLLAFLAVATTTSGYFTWAGVTTFAFSAPSSRTSCTTGSARTSVPRPCRWAMRWSAEGVTAGAGASRPAAGGVARRRTAGRGG